MIPMFEGVQGIDTKNPENAIVQLTAYVGRLERLLERVLMNLGSENFGKLNLGDMILYTENGSEISGDYIKIVGSDGQSFEVGYDREKKQFVLNLPKECEIAVGTLSAERIVRNGEEI